MDFLQEEVAQYTDAEIGAAVRVVHEGCRKALHEHVTLQPEPREERVTVVSVNPRQAGD